MRADRFRTKKLIVAFHFQFANQAGWKCERCRKDGLELKRRCGWAPGAQQGLPRVVWARKRWSLTECPKSYITARSLAHIEEFYAWRLTGRRELADLPARRADAFLILENQALEEENDERR